MEQVARIAETFAGVVRLIVDYPGEVSVLPITDGKGFVLEIEVDARDMGKVIGKMGRTARSLRVIVQAVSLAQKIPLYLDILERTPTAGALRVAAR